MKGPRQSAADCYSAGDRGMMMLSQRARAWLLRPLLVVLTGCGMTADALTILSLVMGLLFCIAFLVSKPLALVLLALHVLFDGLDGPLARYAGTASRRGSFTDTMSDQVVVAATTVTLICAGLISPLPGGLYIFFYTVVIAFSMIRNALSIPYTWLVRPRFFVYVWFIVELYLLPGSIDYVLWASIVLLLAKMVTGFVRIRRRI